MTHGAATKRLAVVVIAAIAATVWALVGGGAGSARADGERAAFVDEINASRQRLAGAEPLRPASDLDEVAGRHAVAMAGKGGLFHNPDLASQVQGWSFVAENVGVGADVAAIHQAFLDSPSHRANVLDRRVTEVGIGSVVSADGRLWVVEIFRQPAAPAAASAPATQVAPAPAPSPRPTRRTSAPPVARPQPAPAAPDTSAEEARAAAEAAAAQAAAAQAAAAEAEAEAARVAAEVAEVVATIDLTTPAPYVAPPFTLPATTALVSTSAPQTTGGPAVVLAAGLWLLVAVGLLRRMRSDVVVATFAVRRLMLRATA